VHTPFQIIAALDPNGFNEMCLSRLGPMLYNKFDTFVGGSLRKYGEFSWGEQVLFQEIVHPGFFVVEVGANIGAHTVGLAKLAGDGGAVFAFEPQRIVFQTLCANLALNQCTNVYAYPQAVGAEDGVIVVPVVDPSQANNFGGVSLLGAEDGEMTDLHRLDSLELPAVHFLKADVEGMEREVLIGAEQTINRDRPILYLENDQDDKSPALIEQVLSLDYDLYWHLPLLYNPDNFAGDQENLFPGIVSVNILCLPSEAEIRVPHLQRITSPGDSWRG